MDTIYALATARGKAGVAVIRLSGGQSFDIARQISGNLPPLREARLRTIRDREGVIDRAVILTFPDHGSFTGEPVVEFHVHGSVAIVERLLAALAKFENCRLAEPGEFTRRALENERLTLAEVEGLADLIEAETHAQHAQAMRVFSGALGERTEGWRADLLRAMALLTATIDFADEEIPQSVTIEASSLIEHVCAELNEELRKYAFNERVRDGFEVAIIGAPNVGKSTLLNAIAGRDVAITSEIAGTTRDIVEVRADLGGLPVTFLDTAGLRQTDDPVESIGVARARQRADAADLRIFLLLPGESPQIEVQKDDLICRAKGDEDPSATRAVSGKTGEGIEALLAEVTKTLTQRSVGDGILIRERHRQAMGQAVESLQKAKTYLNSAMTEELAAEELRAAIHQLDVLVGRIGVEDVLGEIFAAFCLGK